MARIRFAIIGLMFWLSACAGSSAIDAPDAGRTTAYVPGVPNFDMESVVRMDDERPAVDVYYSLPHASLVFVLGEDQYDAEYELHLRLVERTTERIVSEETETERISVSSFDSTLSFHPHLGSRRLHAPPGDYVVEMVLTDLESRESARRRQAVRIGSVGAGDTYVSRILIEGMGLSGRIEPLVSLHIPARTDSLRASVQLYNLTDHGDFEVTMSLVRFETDSSVASPPYWLVPPRGSLEYRGVNYGTVDTIQVSRRLLHDASSSAAIQFSLPRLERGFYRLHLAGRDSAAVVVVDRERLLSVKNPTFPRMTLLEDLIEALAYIAYDNEIDAILEGESPADRKRRFDAFWGTLVSSRNVASNLIELYYGRIEEANLFFTDYKEGWMTDRGMVFTVLGPPLYVDRRIDAEIWYYSYGDRDPANTFVFERARVSRDEPFETYILQRRPYYQNEWARAVDRWRDGRVL